MPTAILEPINFFETLAALRLPAETDQLLQELMDRNNEGSLTVAERRQLESLAELSETISLVRAQALQILQRQP
jgi:hypothetical protein